MNSVKIFWGQFRLSIFKSRYLIVKVNFLKERNKSISKLITNNVNNYSNKIWSDYLNVFDKLDKIINMVIMAQNTCDNRFNIRLLQRKVKVLISSCRAWDWLYLQFRIHTLRLNWKVWIVQLSLNGKLNVCRHLISLYIMLEIQCQDAERSINTKAQYK